MKITTLVENTSISDKFGTEHGLSLYIETKLHKILFDLGASDLFLENAKKLNIDLQQVDTVIISHGHYDHGGGLKTFLELNSTAKIYIKESAFCDYYSIREKGEAVYIGLDKSLKESNRFTFCEDYKKIDDELELFSGVSGRELFSLSNNVLKKMCDEKLVNDDFKHEQNLIVTECGKSVLICGCAHNGVLNILNFYIKMKWEVPEFVIGGFHLSNPRTKKTEDKKKINRLAIELAKFKSTYFTCHCTGQKPYMMLKDVLKDKIYYIGAGSFIDLE